MNFNIPIIISIVALSLSINALAQEDNQSEIKIEIEAAVSEEQNAFKNGDCDTVLSMMDDNITFLANGNKVPSKKVISGFCNSIKRPFKTPLTDTIHVYVLTDSSAYTIRNLTYAKDEKTIIHEYVTKIWKKHKGIWKITHLHSTVKERNTASK